MLELQLSPANIALAAAILFSTLLISNIIAGALERARERRIAQKCEQIVEGSDHGGRTTAASKDTRAVVPVTIIVGWLGSGKTTLLNRLLASPQGRRLCVIENEAGSISIDHTLLQTNASGASGGGASDSLPPGGVIVLKNGCICCSAGGTGDELERVLDKLLTLQQQRRDFDHVIIEASGLADPAPLVSTFFATQLASRYALDSVIAVVDAKHIGRHLDGKGLLPSTRDAGRQVAYADVVLLNKVDVATDEQVRAALAAIGDINPIARVLRCSQCEVNTADLLGQAAFNVNRARSLLLRTNGEGNRKLEGAHDRDIRAITIPMGQAPVPLAPLRSWLQSLVTAHWGNLYRLKGVLWVQRDVASASLSDRSGTTGLFVIQGVHAELHASFVPTPNGSSRNNILSDHSEGALRDGSDSVEPTLEASGLRRRGGAGPPKLKLSRPRSGISGLASQATTSAAVKSSSVASSDGYQHGACGEGCDHAHHHHGSGSISDSGPSSGSDSDGALHIEPALVLIGRKLDEGAIRASLHAAGLLAPGRERL